MLLPSPSTRPPLFALEGRLNWKTVPVRKKGILVRGVSNWKTVPVRKKGILVRVLLRQLECVCECVRVSMCILVLSLLLAFAIVPTGRAGYFAYPPQRS